jgi:hypothetical protein
MLFNSNDFLSSSARNSLEHSSLLFIWRTLGNIIAFENPFKWLKGFALLVVRSSHWNIKEKRNRENRYRGKGDGKSSTPVEAETHVGDLFTSTLMFTQDNRAPRHCCGWRRSFFLLSFPKLNLREGEKSLSPAKTILRRGNLIKFKFSSFVLLTLTTLSGKESEIAFKPRIDVICRRDCRQNNIQRPNVK